MNGTQLAVAGILVREGRLLMSRRPSGGAWPGPWELPGGKVEDGETPEEALVREWREELDATPLGPVPYDFGTESGVVPDGSRCHVTLLFFRVRGLRGTPRAKGVDALRWCPSDEGACRNVCPHVPIPLDRDGEPLLAADGLFLVCRNHGALFATEDGLCVAGPCEGESLDPLRITRLGAGWALDGGGTR